MILQAWDDCISTYIENPTKINQTNVGKQNIPFLMYHPFVMGMVDVLSKMPSVQETRWTSLTLNPESLQGLESFRRVNGEVDFLVEDHPS